MGTIKKRPAKQVSKKDLAKPARVSKNKDAPSKKAIRPKASKKSSNPVSRSKNHSAPSTKKPSESKTPDQRPSKTRENNIDEPFIYETVLDEIVKRANDSSTLSIKKLAKELSITEDQLETWAKVLDRHGLLEIDYPFVGDIRINKKGYAEEQAKKKTEKAPKTRDKSVDKTPKNASQQKKLDTTIESSKDAVNTVPGKKRKMPLLFIILGIVIVGLIAFLVFLLVSGGYIPLGQGGG